MAGRHTESTTILQLITLYTKYEATSYEGNKTMVMKATKLVDFIHLILTH